MCSSVQDAARGLGNHVHVDPNVHRKDMGKNKPVAWYQQSTKGELKKASEDASQHTRPRTGREPPAEDHLPK